MAMAMARALSAAILLGIISICKSSNNQLVNGLEGSNVTFPFKRPPETDEILLTFQGNKVLEWEDGKNVSYFGNFFERTNLIGNTIMIKNLLLNDSGIYKLAFTSTAGTLVEVIYQLFVNVPLSKPTISCDVNDSIIHLTCSVTVPVTREWKYENRSVQQSEHFDLTPEGTSLAIKNPELFPGEYTCIVKQPGDLVQSDPFNIKQCLENEKGRNRILLIIAVIVIIIVVAILVVFVVRKCIANKLPCGEFPKRESSQEDGEAKPESAQDREESKLVVAENGEETKPQPSGNPVDQRRPSSKDAEGDLALNNLDLKQRISLEM
ncbi:uncharacterized protein LOC144598811 [Rhinoraja longicauda]